MNDDVAAIRKQLVVKARPERAFRVFTEGMDRWWPREHHIGASPMKQLVIEPRPGGRWYTACEDGSECDTGRVLVWEPPHRVVLTWQITAQWKFDPDFVTEIEVRFTPEGEHHTRVDFEHRHLERYGEAAPDLLAQLDHPSGWGGMLALYARVTGWKAVVLYESAADVLTAAPAHFPAHQALVEQFRDRGDLLAVGTFADPRDGAMALFRTREAAEEFVRADPFVQNGVVVSAAIKDWNEVLLP